MDTESTIASPNEDGAGDKLVDEKNGHKSKGVEIKYATPTSQNGDAKIDMDNMKSSFAGMGKEELMKFANDPFWVRTRWFLFILFWVLWIAMLAGAIAIIVLAPKCAPPTPRKLWEQSPVYKADVAAFIKEPGNTKGDIKGLTSNLNYLETLGVKTVVVPNILKGGFRYSNGKDEFESIDPSFGTMDDFKELLSAANKKGIMVILTLTPNNSTVNNTFFKKSINKDPEFSSFYVWETSKTFGDDGKPLPPNNWQSVTGESAWEWNDERKQFYLHQFDKEHPDFNFHYPQVVKYFEGVMTFWLNLGVRGFYLENAAYLLEDSDLHNETIASTRNQVGGHKDYGFYDHSRTRNLPELESLLTNWTYVVGNKSGILLVDDVVLGSNKTVGNLNIQPQLLDSASKLTAEQMKRSVNKTLMSSKWPTWQVRIKDEPEGSPLSQAVMLSTMLLPGVPVTFAGQELGLANLAQIPADKIQSAVKETKEGENEGVGMFAAYKRLVKERASPSILYGSTELHVFNGSEVFSYTRIKSGNPGHLVVLNIGKEKASVDLRQLKQVPDDLTLVVSSNFTSELEKKSGANIVLPGHTMNVYNFVPLKE